MKNALQENKMIVTPLTPIPEVALTIDIGSAMIIGARSDQQDRLACGVGSDGSSCLAVLADGMGGHNNGAIASELVINTFSHEMIEKLDEIDDINVARTQMVDTLMLANKRLQTFTTMRPESAGCGTTLLACALKNGRLSWVSVGDSSLFMLRNGKIMRLNTHHSFAEQLDAMVRKGSITRAEADAHPKRNAITSAVTGASIPHIDKGEIVVDSELCLIVASDGLETLSADEMADVILSSSGHGAQQVAEDLVTCVDQKDQPEQDNISLIVMHIEIAQKGQE